MGTGTEKFTQVMGRVEAATARHGIFPLTQRMIMGFLTTAARAAPQEDVMSMDIGDRTERISTVHRVLMKQSRCGQRFDDAVDGHQTDIAFFPADKALDIFNQERLSARCQHAENRAAWKRVLKAVLPENQSIIVGHCEEF